MRALQRRAALARTATELLGLEGEAAAIYFSRFSTMLTVREASGSGLQLRVRPTCARPRQRRPQLRVRSPARPTWYGPWPPAVSIPTPGSCTRARGTSPPSPWTCARSSGRQSPTRPSSARSTTASWCPGDFSDVLGTTRLSRGGRRALIAAYERRVQTEFRHPVFGYRLTWRRAMEVQARDGPGRHRRDARPRYVGIRTR